MSDPVVVDTSIALKWAVPEDDSAQAAALLDHWIANGYDVIAPSLYVSEVTNVLFKKARRGIITMADAASHLATLILSGPALDFADDPAVNLVLSRRALELAQALGLPATYDAHYLALAEREGCEYWTADERLWNAAHPSLGWVRLLREFAPPAP